MAVKQIFDLTIAAAFLLCLAPMLAAIALAVRLGDGGPAFALETRVGKDGRTFGLYKFRTTGMSAEPAARRGIASGSPQMTAVGARLHRWGLAELPQLINVFAGDMSMVGPRPALPREAALYRDDVQQRLVMKPGLTGLWCLTGRSHLTWDEAHRLDLRYAENWSFAMDLIILWRSCIAAMRWDNEIR